MLIIHIVLLLKIIRIFTVNWIAANEVSIEWYFVYGGRYEGEP